MLQLALAVLLASPPPPPSPEPPPPAVAEPATPTEPATPPPLNRRALRTWSANYFTTFGVVGALGVGASSAGIVLILKSQQGDVNVEGVNYGAAGISVAFIGGVALTAGVAGLISTAIARSARLQLGQAEIRIDEGLTLRF